jgi:hypothetical protein
MQAFFALGGSQRLFCDIHPFFNFAIHRNHPVMDQVRKNDRQPGDDILDGGCAAKPAAARVTCAQSVDLHSNFIYINQYAPHRVRADGQMSARISFEAAAGRF